MKVMMLQWRTIRKVAGVVTLAAALGGMASAQYFAPPDTSKLAPPELKGVGIDQHLNAPVPLDLTFTDEQGKTVKLGDYFHSGEPVILNLVYYNCPMLCTEVLNGLTAAMKVMPFQAGKQFQVVTLSIDPTETPQLAASKKASYLKRLGNPAAGAGWHFLTGKEPQIKQLADAVGWHYRYEPKLKQYAHAAGILLVTPEGRIAQYYYGVEYSARDLRLGIEEASQNKIGSLADQVLLYCYCYNPVTGRYGARIANILKLAGVTTMVLLGGGLIFLSRKEKHDPGKGTGRA
jgi:protein SCO1/2